jgi:hypothetical protein
VPLSTAKGLEGRREGLPRKNKTLAICHADHSALSRHSLRLGVESCSPRAGAHALELSGEPRRTYLLIRAPKFR